MSAWSVKRALLGVVGAAGIAGMLAGALTTAPTQSAWTDTVVLSAPISAGTWTTPTPPPAPVTGNSCTAMNADGTPLAGGTCEITSIQFQQWGNDVARDYYIRISLPKGDHAVITVDLRTAVSRNGHGAQPGDPEWAWSTSVTTGGGSHILAPGFSCSSLPMLQLRTMSNYGKTPEAWVHIVDTARQGVSNPTCS